MRLFGRISFAILLIILTLTLYLKALSFADEIEKVPHDPAISNICSPGGCSPAEPCAEKDEKCYTINGAFYCCFEPPGGAEAVGE